jgi:hypothetical protein
MKYTYEETINFDETKTIVATDENGSVLFIPNDPANSDYQAYLEHEASTK